MAKQRMETKLRTPLWAKSNQASVAKRGERKQLLHAMIVGKMTVTARQVVWTMDMTEARRRRKRQKDLIMSFQRNSSNS